MELADLEPTITSIAYRFRNGKRYGIEVEDMAQEFRLWCWDRLGIITEWFDEDERVGTRRLTAALVNRGRDILTQAKAETVGYATEDLVYYTLGELEVLLESVFDREAWNSPPSSEDGGRSNKSPAEGGNWIATLADVSRAITRLPLDDAAILRNFYEQQLTNGEIAHRMGSTHQKVSYYKGRALTRLQRILGGEKPRTNEYDPSKGRHAVSNAQARAVTRSSYLGDEPDGQ